MAFSLLLMNGHGMLTPEEIAQFSPELQEHLAQFD
jgi:hypothetical protein